MGLDINPGRAHWSYGGFNEFRRALAREEGFDLDAMVGFGGERDWPDVRTFLAPLLNHSDCDGYLNGYECEDMLPRLRQIAEKWGDDKNRPIDRHYDLQQLRNLIDGMEHCVAHRCALVFS